MRRSRLTKKSFILGTLWIVLCLVVLGLVSGALERYNLRSVQQQQAESLKVPVAPIYTREELLVETNKERVKAQVAPVALDSVLNDTAQVKCEDMAARDDFNHGDLQTIADRINRIISENIVYGYDSAERVIDAFVGSPSHYAAMIDTKYTRVGFGVCPFRGSELVVQHFSN